MSDICLNVQNNFLEQAKVIRTLGKGTYGRVELVESDGNQYALKYQKYRENRTYGIKQATLIELDTLTRLKSHPNVIQLTGVCISPLKNELVLILEPLDYSLYDFILKFPSSIRCRHFPTLLKDYFRAASVLEMLNINHYDIGPKNILVNYRNECPTFKLADFGLSRGCYPGVPSQKEIVTVAYRPPELLAARDRTTFSETKIDIWSFGVTASEYLLGHHLYYNIYDSNVILSEIAKEVGYGPNFFFDIITGNVVGVYPILKILQQKMKPEDLQSIPNDYLVILQAILSLNPRDRPNPRVIYGNDDNLIPFVNSLHPVEGPRFVGPTTVSIFNRLESNESYVTAIIGIEILTRYYGIIGSSFLLDIVHSAAAYHLASTYLEDFPKSLFEVAQKFGLSKFIGPVQIDQEETRILPTLKFVVYNSNLTPRITHLYQKLNGNRCHIIEYLKGLPSTHFTQPISLWFE